jgi:methyltransferase (TIGR00027 family)
MSSLASVGRTARWAAAQRAKESERPDRLFEDPFARALAGDDGIEMLRLSEQFNPQHERVAALLAVRTRFFDDMVQRATAGGTRQVVMVAAGLDSRAFRLGLPNETEFYELDQKAVLDLKDEILRGEDARPLYRRSAIPVDLSRHWATELKLAGFKNERSLWIVEGLLYYLTEPTVRHLLSEISGCAVEGSVLGADTVSESFFHSPWTKGALELLRQVGMDWQFGTDDPEVLLGEYGWQTKVLEPGDEGINYGRWSWPVPPRENRELPHTFFVTATKQ